MANVILKFRLAIKYYLVICGVILHLGFFAAVIYALDYYSLSPRQFVIKAAEKAGFENSVLTSILEPPARYGDHSLDGARKLTAPRIILPQLSDWSGSGLSSYMEDRFNGYRHKSILTPPIPCNNSHDLFHLISCWLATGEEDKATLAIEKLLIMKPETPDSTAKYGNGWQLALAYDLLSTYKKFSEDQKLQVEQKIEHMLIDYLRVLDEDSASLWHGRLTLASNAWLCAIVLSNESPFRKKLVNRAQGHFIDSVRAITMTEAWPGGYNYWINNRGFTFVLASAAYINGLENSQYAETIKHLLARVGLWTIYATRPDNRIEGYADEGPRVDLKDETQRVIDLIAGQTNNDLIASYSRFLSQLHGREGYYRDYRWGFYLFNDPDALSSSRFLALQDFDERLPKVELFGKFFTNKLYIRSSWQPDATFISYSAGHSFTHHGHYDAGHFSIFKTSPLAANSSTYGSFTGENRLNYSIRTVAKNSLLILRPYEKVKPNHYFSENVSDGGQRITLPTGSAITSTAHWSENLHNGLQLGGAELDAFEKQPDFTYIKSNLTNAYNNVDYDENHDGGKVERVSRELLYLFSKDILLVHDRIKTTNANYRTKWLLHSVKKPIFEKEKVLVGTKTNGITESDDNQALLVNDKGYLDIKVLWPKKVVTHSIGGPNYKFYVETDGDDQSINGQNFSQGASYSDWFDNPQWRIEISPAKQTKSTDFLVSLGPSINKPTELDIQAINSDSTTELASLVDDTMVVFNRSSTSKLELNVPGKVKSLYLIGYRRMPTAYTVDHGEISPLISDGKVFKFDLTAHSTGKQIILFFK